MKKLISFSICMGLLFFLTSCVKTQTPNKSTISSIQATSISNSSVQTSSTTGSSASSTYKIENSYITITNTSAKYFIQTYIFTDESHKNSKVTIRFPELIGNNLDKVNGIIKDYVIGFAANCYGADYSGLSLDVDYHLTFNDDDWLSISFNGFGNVKTAAYPNDILQTMNINLKNGSMLKLSDIYTVNKDFAHIFRKEYVEQITSRFDLADDLAGQAVKTFLDQYDDQTLMGYLSDSCCYMTPNKLGISFDLPHAAGDHFETEIPYSALSQDLKMKTAPFNLVEIK